MEVEKLCRAHLLNGKTNNGTPIIAPRRKLLVRTHRCEKPECTRTARFVVEKACDDCGGGYTHFANAPGSGNVFLSCVC